MNHLYRIVVTVAIACAAAFALSGCEAIGLGPAGNGVPQVGNATIAAPAIGEDGVLRVGVNGANAPFSTTVEGKLVGIDVDIAAALANEMGLKVKVVDVGSTPEDSLKSGAVDVVMGIDSSDTSTTYWLSEPYLNTAVAIFSTSSGAILPTKASKPIIEAQESSMSAWEITNQFGETSLKAVPDLKKVFEDLESGVTTYGASDAIIGSYVTHTSGGKAMIIGLMQKPSGYCVGVASENTELSTAVAEAVSSLVGKGVADVVESKWIGESIDLDAIALTDAAAKGLSSATKPTSTDKSKESKLGKVGSNAVDLKDDGSTGEGNDAPIAAEGYWGTAEVADQNTGYVDQGYANQGYVDQGYVDNGGTGYVDPVGGDQGGAVDGGDVGYVEPAADPGIVDAGTDAGGEAAQGEAAAA